MTAHRPPAAPWSVEEVAQRCRRCDDDHCWGPRNERRCKNSVSYPRKSLQCGHYGPACSRGSRPGQMGPRTELGWRFDHLIGYFGITLFFCFAWPRPLAVGGIIMAVAASLESLQALSPDRSANREAALWGAGGALAAALVAELFSRVRRWRLKSAAR